MEVTHMVVSEGAEQEAHWVGNLRDSCVPSVASLSLLFLLSEEVILVVVVGGSRVTGCEPSAAERLRTFLWDGFWSSMVPSSTADLEGCNPRAMSWLAVRSYLSVVTPGSALGGCGLSTKEFPAGSSSIRTNVSNGASFFSPSSSSSSSSSSESFPLRVLYEGVPG